MIKYLYNPIHSLANKQLFVVQIFQVVTTFRQAMTTDANTGSGTSNGTVFLMDTTMPTGTDDSTVSNFTIEA